MKIAIITQRFERGGLESQIKILLSHFLKENKVVLISSNPVIEEIDDKVKIYCIENLKSVRNEDILVSANKIKDILNSEHIDYCFIHPYFSLVSGTMAAIDTQTPYSVVIHSPYNIGSDNAYFYLQFLNKIAFKQADKIIAISQEVINKITKIDNYENIVLIENPIVKINSDIKNSNGSLIISRLDADKFKSISSAIDFYKKHLSNIEKYKGLTIWGQGTVKDLIEKYVKDKGISSQVIFNSEQSNFEQIAKANVVFGMGRNALDTMINGKPLLIVSPEGGVVDFVTKENFEKYAESNFTGRGFENVSPEKIIRSLKAETNDNIQKLAIAINKRYGSENIFKQYNNIIKNANANMFSEGGVVIFKELLEKYKSTFIYDQDINKDLYDLINNVNKSDELKADDVPNKITIRPKNPSLAFISFLRNIYRPLKNLFFLLFVAIKFLLKKKNKFLVAFQVIPWSETYQRPQHLLKQFVKDDFFVLAVNIGFYKIKKQPANLLSKLNSFYIHNVESNIWQITLPCLNLFNPYKKPINGEDLGLIINTLNFIFKFIANLNNKLIYVNYPGWMDVIDGMHRREGDKVIFDYMDDNSEFTNNGDYVKEYEELIIKKSDIILASSEVLFDRAKKLNEKVVLIRNAVDYDCYNKGVSNGFLKNLNKPIIGYIGAISYWFDLENITYVIEKHPEWNFVLIGPVEFGLDEFAKYKNVHVLGQKPYKELPGYVADFDVGLIPFVINKLTQAVNPLKLYEYLAAGKPVVTADFPESVDWPCYIYKDKIGLENSIKSALNDKDYSKRQSYAIKNTWEQRFNILKKYVEDIK